MSTEEKMTVDERRKYLRRMQKRYRKASQKEKGQLLDEMEQVTELERKYLIGLMKSDLQRQPRRKQRGRTYGPEVEDALRVIHESFDYICAERLTPIPVYTGTGWPSIWRDTLNWRRRMSYWRNWDASVSPLSGTNAGHQPTL